MKKLFWITLLVLPLLMLVVAKGESSKMRQAVAKIFFIPFEIETYMPVSTKNIEEYSQNIIGFYNQHEFCKMLPEVLERTKKKVDIDNKKIRFKFENYVDKKIYFIDQSGVVKRNDGRTFILNKEELKKLEAGILYFSGVIDLKVEK